MYKTPITYYPISMPDPGEVYTRLMNELDWVARTNVRKEYYWAKNGLAYVYGSGRGQREYLSQPSHPVIDEMCQLAKIATCVDYDVVFLNRYDTQYDHLGWHADNSPEMDDNFPIVIISVGAEREIWFRENPTDLTGKCVACNGSGFYDMRIGKENIYCSSCHGSGKGEPGAVEKLKLRNGSMCVMHTGMQDTHQHRIPKAGFVCGPRISLTLRKYVKP